MVRADPQAKLKERLHRLSGAPGHMSKVDTFFEENEHRVAYETSLYGGTSGSPGLDFDGNITVLHTQNYFFRDDTGKTYSLMEFGVSFYDICNDLESRFPSISYQLFPNWKKLDEPMGEPMEEDNPMGL